MGCHCKKTYDKVKKFADNKEQLEQKENEINQNIVNKMARFIMQIFAGIIASCLFIIVVIPITIYIIGCILLGKQPSVIIKNPKNIFKKKNAR